MRFHFNKTYDQIDNEIYNKDDSGWWNPDSPLHLIKLVLNPVRISYIQRKLDDHFPLGPKGKIALEVGCGGGILCEDLSRLGIHVFGIDPSEKSISCAKRHAKQNDLLINYSVAEGEDLPFRSAHFDIVFCCDTLEHVRDLSKVTKEISRVLKTGGIFIFDTINRTLFSNLVAINILQHWKHWAVLPDNLHVWEKFIRPTELKAVLSQHSLEMKEKVGMIPNISPLKIAAFLHQRASGKLSNKEFGTKFRLIEGRFLKISYMGYAIKNT